MIRLLAVFVWIIPATIWFGGRMIVAVVIGARNRRCICRNSPRGWARQLLWLSSTNVVFENADGNIPRVVCGAAIGTHLRATPSA